MKALQTHYRGITYRSRTEARWALFFDLLKLEAVYEGEGFDLDGEWYLPDFWLPHSKTWVEIKGIDPVSIEVEKARRLSGQSGRDVIIAVGAPTTDHNSLNLIHFVHGAESGRLTFVDWGADFIALGNGQGSFEIVLKGDPASIGGMAYPEHSLDCARKVQAARFGVHE
jgi:radical SAM superfamily enzyme YgiQ (UPF0313 family)